MALHPTKWARRACTRELLAAAIVQLFIYSSAQILILEIPVGILELMSGPSYLLSILHKAEYTVETAALSATAVGVPTSERRVLAVVVKRQLDPNLADQLEKWKLIVERPLTEKPTDSYFLASARYLLERRGKGDKDAMPLGRWRNTHSSSAPRST